MKFCKITPRQCTFSFKMNLEILILIFIIRQQQICQYCKMENRKNIFTQAKNSETNCKWYEKPVMLNNACPSCKQGGHTVYMMGMRYSRLLKSLTEYRFADFHKKI